MYSLSFPEWSSEWFARDSACHVNAASMRGDDCDKEAELLDLEFASNEFFWCRFNRAGVYSLVLLETNC